MSEIVRISNLSQRGLPLISVVIPTYNAGESLSQAIQSVVDQTFRRVELVIVDGGSTDNTMDIVQRFREHIGYQVSEADGGTYDAMNKGVRAAKGCWVYFLGADDKLHDHGVLERLAGILSSTDCRFVYGDVKMVGSNNWAKDGQIYAGEFTIERLFCQNICHQSIFYSRDIFDELGYFNPSYKICADWDFNHRCFSKLTPRYVNEVIAIFAAGGISTKGKSDMFVAEDSIFKLKAYYGIKYSNKLYSTFSKVFARNAKKLIRQGSILSGFYLLTFALYHSDNKYRTLRYMMSGQM